MARVELFHWNPRRLIAGPYLRKFVRIRMRVNNFGDLLGPIVVKALLKRHGINPDDSVSSPARLITIGSVLHLCTDGDVIWGTGLNGKVEEKRHTFAELDVRAVRGPLTRQFLQTRGIHVPEVYGDPALLTPLLIPGVRRWAATKIHDVTVVPNYRDVGDKRFGSAFLDPRKPLWNCLRRIAQSRLVVGSSLHALIIAESLNIPARAIRSNTESEIKYADYYGGTGRSRFTMASNVGEAIQMGGEPPLQWSCRELLEAFPIDLWD